MSTHRYIDRLCAAAAALCLLLTIVFMNGEGLGLQPAASAMGYEDRLFDTQRVHTLDIVMDDWDSFIETCENEEYAQCAVVIDGEAYKNTAIRAKGNTSLSMVSSMDSYRYSFKLEFDHYDSGRTYYGLDKLSLNNIIQDSTYMKDYLTYRMMGAFGVDAPLCSYVYITVNGEDWGLYLAVEGVENAFLQRNYGSNYGELYKPDSTGFGGGRGNGRNFNMEDLTGADKDNPEAQVRFPAAPPEDFNPSRFSEDGAFPTPPDGQEAIPGDQGHEGGGHGGMGSDDVKLRYVDDDPDSYSNIFQNAKTDVSEADQQRLISALKELSACEELENTLDIEEVLRYFVVHNFVVNGDSYTGSMVHNYYLYEEDGQLSMIPWDYNLAFGTFQGGNASSAVNDPIDTPLSVTGSGDRPMADWIYSSEKYIQLYHQYFQDFLDTVDITAIIDEARELIAPYVKKDPTAFYTYGEFETGTEALQTFCVLRAESVRGQLDGSIPSTSESQSSNSTALVDASGLTLSDMGTINHGGGPGEGGPSGKNRMPEERPGMEPPSSDETEGGKQSSSSEAAPSLPGQSSGQETEKEPNGQAVEVLQAGPPDFPEGFDRHNGNDPFPGAHGESPGEMPAAVNGCSLILGAVSLCVLIAGVLFALLYRRRGR